MKNVNVLFTNPPYHSLNEDGIAVGRLWWNIVDKSLKKNPEKAMLIVPSSFHSPGSFRTSRYKLQKLVKMGYYITHLNSNICERFGGSVAIPISTINLSREEPDHAIIDGHPFVLRNNLLDGKYPIPFYVNKNSCNIIRKCFNVTDPPWPIKGSIEDGVDPEAYGVVMESGRFSYYHNKYIGKLENSIRYGETIFYNKEDHDSIKSIFETKLFRYMYRYLGGESQQSRSASLMYTPRLSTDRIWTDDEVFDKFGLNNDEIEEIEADAATKYLRWE